MLAVVAWVALGFGIVAIAMAIIMVNVLQGLVKEDRRLRFDLNQLDTRIHKVREDTIYGVQGLLKKAAVKAYVISEDYIEDQRELRH